MRNILPLLVTVLPVFLVACIEPEPQPTTVLLYDIDFESPDHDVGTPPIFGFGPSRFPENFGIGTFFEQFSPYVVSDVPELNGQSLLFESQLNATGSSLIGDTAQLSLGHRADTYVFSLDLVAINLTENSRFKIFLDWVNSDNLLDFSADGIIRFNDGIVGTYSVGEATHISCSINIAEQVITLTINNGEPVEMLMDINTMDLGSIRFYLFEQLDQKVAVDNIRVTATFNTELESFVADSPEGYLIDFDLPYIESSSGQSGAGLSPFKEDGFNVISVLRKDPSLSAVELPSNGTIIGSATSNSFPVIYHQYGYTFRLKQMDIASYSPVVPHPYQDVTVVGERKDGIVLSTVIPKELFTSEFTTYVFPNDWYGLYYVSIATGGFSFDNILLSLEDETIGFTHID